MAHSARFRLIHIYLGKEDTAYKKFMISLAVCPTTTFWGGLFYLKGCLQILEFEKISVINRIIRHCTDSTVFKYILLLVDYFSNVYHCFFVIIFI